MEVFDSSTKPSYFFNGPFRFVKAYEHCFKTHAKGRWVGNPILDTLEKEFKAYSREYYQNAIEKGKILVNKQKQNINYRFKNNDLFEHYTLRVEPPVLNVLPKVIFEDDNVFVISKPPYISVHATGGFHFNSLVGLLKFQMGYNSELHVLHRIDKLTSGVLIMAKDRDITKKFHESDEIQKFYLARVHGNFPHDNLVYEKPIYCISKKEGTYAVLDSTDEEEIKTKGAKQSKTVFKKLWYDEVSDSTLLECQPITGRTHQIRVHVSSLGFPIINDTLYGGKFLGNGLIMVKFPHLFTNVSTESDKVIGETTESEIIQQEIKNEKISQQKAESNKDDQEEQKVESNANGDEDKLETIEKKQKNNEGEAATTVVKVLQGNEQGNQTEQKNKSEKEESSSALMQNHLKEVGEDGAYKLTEENGIYKLEGNYIENHEWDYQTQPMEICLHSVKYIFQSYIFEDEKPYWADQNFNFKI